MNQDAFGLIFTGEANPYMRDLVLSRAVAAVPFGGRYRIIDFVLSNLVNSGIRNVGLITQKNYHSLMDHLGTGKEWDLNRKRDGLFMLPPFSTKDNTGVYRGDIDAFHSVMQYIRRSNQKYLVLCGSHTVFNTTFDAILKQHRESGADVTVAVKSRCVDGMTDVSVVHSDETGRVVDVTNFNDNVSGDKDVQIHMLVFNRNFLLYQLNEAVAHGYTSLAKDILTRGAGRYNFRIYRFDGYCETIRNLSEYYQRNMDLLLPETQDALFRAKNRPVLTAVHNSSPTVYAESSLVKNSLIADGCVIEGIVENSIIARGVRIGKNTSVENCVLMDGTYVGDNVYLNCVVTDKDVMIRDGRVLSGHETRPFYIEKSSEV